MAHFKITANLKEMDIQSILEQLTGIVVAWGPKILGALAVLIIGLWIIGRIVSGLSRTMEKRGVDPSLRPFLTTLASVILKLLLIISVAELIGVKTTSFVAVLGAAGLAIGLALQGGLANFASGVLILIFKPYKVGDLVEAAGEFGQVQGIQVFNTILNSPENKQIIIPNGAVTAAPIKNYTVNGWIRVDIPVGISYNDDIKKAKEVMMEVMRNNPAVLKDPAPEVHVVELGDNSVNLQMRPYATAEDYWAAYFGCLEECKVALDKHGISIPFPQRDVHLYQHNA